MIFFDKVSILPEYLENIICNLVAWQLSLKKGKRRGNREKRTEVALKDK